MEYTTRYAIAKHGPEGEGEALSAYSIVNVAMDRIDEIFWEFQEKIDEIWSRIGVIEDRLDSAEANITQLWSEVNELKERVTQVETNIENINTSITEINNNITEINNNITEINNNITDIGTEFNDDVYALWTAIRNIVSHIVGSGSVDADTGAITWGISGTVPVGDINLYSGTGAIRATENTSDSPGTNDVRVQ